MDVSFLAGMLVDKFRYHLPLYRQHQRLAEAGIRVSRSSLTNWAGHAVDLLEPITAAQAVHIRQGHVIGMDETSIKAGRAAPGKMRSAYSGRSTGRRTRSSSITPGAERTNMWKRSLVTSRAPC